MDGGTVNAQLAQLVPIFDPGTDSLEVWSQKVELLIQAWPPNKLQELGTRIILNCRGTAFKKLQLRQSEILTGEKKGILKAIEILGGTYGQVALEQKFEVVEKAIYRCTQKNDEAADSFLARADISWTELIAKKVSLEEVQAYVTLRGSRLSPEDKKRVPVESGAERGGALEMPKVTAAVRMLGSQFFQEYTSGKREKGLKTYDHTTLVMDSGDEGESTFWSQEEPWDEETLESLAAEDEDAALVLQFEGAVMESIQEDTDLAVYYTSYIEARRRLNEKAKSRGFWPVSKGSKGGNNQKGSKGKSKGRGFRSLAQRIAESNCRLCGKVGHWKAECPSRKQGSDVSQAGVVPTTALVEVGIASSSDVMEGNRNMETADAILMSIPEIEADTWMKTESLEKNQMILFSENIQQSFVSRLKNSLHQRFPSHHVRKSAAQMKPLRSRIACTEVEVVSEECTNLFASSGTSGVVDLGASQTVIGSEQMKELLTHLPEQIRSQIRKTSCNLTFRFGNHQTLPCRHAIMFPLQGTWFRVAIVEGKTPFLLSSNFLRHTLKAVIDTDECTLWSKTLKRFLNICPTQKNLFLLDINQLWEDECAAVQDTLQVQEFKTHDASNHPFEDRVQKIEQTCQSGISENSQQSKIVNPNEEKVAQAPCETVFAENHEKKCSEQAKIVQKLEDTTMLKIVHDHCVKSFEPQKHSKSDPCRSPVENHVETPRTTQGLSEGPSHAQCREHESRRDVSTEDILRKGKIRKDLCGSFRRPVLDPFHRQHVREELKTRAFDVHPLCGENGVRDKSPRRPKDDPKPGQSANKLHGDSSGTKSQLLGQSNGGTSCLSATGSVSERTETVPTGVYVGRGRDPHATALGATGEQCSLADGEVRARGLSAELREKIQIDAMMAQSIGKPELDFEISTDEQSMSYSFRCKQLMLRQELAEVRKVVKPLKKTAFLFEVMCSSTSELVRQCWMQGLKAYRFGRNEGDLSTKKGRMNLFAHLVALSPENLWISPECRPWCRWSAFNLMRSPETCQKVLKDRYESLWQVALTRVLFEHQVEEQKNFHVEQLEGSSMFNLPSFGPILEKSLRCKFDLCTVGDLKDPNNGKPIRKRLLVLTGSKELFNALNFRLCPGNHAHQQIEGSLEASSQRIAMSKFTERYPRKFARQIVQALLRGKTKPVWTLMQTEAEDHPTKRRRLDMKASPLQIALRHEPNWEDIMKLANTLAKRVGVSIIENGPLLEAVKRKCPQHDIRHVVLCRGTDRLLGPNKPMYPGEATLRKFVCIRRRHEDIVEEPWEPWERLSARQLRRKGTPARIGVTIFGKTKDQETVMEQQPEIPQTEDRERKELNQRVPEDNGQITGEENPAKRWKSSSSENAQPAAQPAAEESGEPDRHMIDLVSEKHGPKFQKLSTEDIDHGYSKFIGILDTLELRKCKPFVVR